MESLTGITEENKIRNLRETQRPTLLTWLVGFKTKEKVALQKRQKNNENKDEKACLFFRWNQEGATRK